jgi:hypothetical protein
MELRAEIVHDRDDGNGNPGGDQAIFDGGRPVLVSEELAQLCAHGG